ncbi:hypothetical protein [Nocardioides montaniterrae]
MSVRREAVRLDVEGNFAEKVLEDAAAVKLLDHELKNLSGHSVQTSRSQDRLAKDIDKTGQSARKASGDLDRYSGRLGILAAAVGAFGPGLIPIGGVGIAGLGGLTNDMGMAAVAGGSLIVAFHGVVDAAKVMNKAALEPTSANLEAAHQAMEHLVPAARQFVIEFQKFRPLLGQIQQSAASGWFPGLTKAMHELVPLAPTIEKIFHDVGTAGGNLVAQGAKALAGPQWREFWQFIDTEAPKAMAAMGKVVGSLAHGLSQVWMAFQPLNDGFNNWLINAAHSFDLWATNLSKTQGFQDFVSYIEQTGPQVSQALGAIAKAVIAIMRAAAPMGGPVLKAVTAFADAIAKIADSPLGTPIMAAVTAMSALNIATKLATGSMKALGIQAVLTGEEAAAAGAAGGAGGGLKGKLLGPTLAAMGLQYAAGQSGSATSQNAFASAAAAQNLEGMKAHLADMESHYNDWQHLAGHGGGFFGGLGVIAHHPLDAVNDSFSDVLGEGRSGLKAKIDAAKHAIADLEAQENGAKGSSRGLATAMNGLGSAMKQSAQEALGAFDAETNYREALKAAKKQADSNSAGIKGNSDAALKNREALGQLAAAWQNQSQAVRSNSKRQHEARQDFIRTAEAMGVGIPEARRLAKAIIDIPPKKVIPVTVQDQQAKDSINVLRNLIEGHPIIQTIKVQHVGQAPGNVSGSGAMGAYLNGGKGNGKADGGTIPKTGLPYADRHPYLLADGEEVISNRYGQADRHRSLLKAINAGRLADGGTVGRSRAMGGTVRHVIEVKVVGGELDLGRAKQQIHAIAREVSSDEDGQQSAFDEFVG